MDSIKICNAYKLIGYSLVSVVMAAWSLGTHAQILLERQVIGSTGSAADHAGTIYAYTVGEVVVATLIQNPILLTQGFQQPEVTLSHHIPQMPSLTDFIVFPNPAIDYTTIRFNLLAPGDVRVMLVNNAGQIVFSDNLDVATGKSEYNIPLQRYASGLYYLVLSVGASQKYTEKLIIQ